MITSEIQQTSTVDHDYETLLGQLALPTDKHFFTTDATGLFELFLVNLPPEHRQHYTCRACQHFVERYGHLVTIDSKGRTASAVWPSVVPSFFDVSILAMRERVQGANVTGVFYANEHTWGTPVTGDWHHLSVLSPVMFYSKVQSPAQAMAEKAEDHKMLTLAILEYNPQIVAQALTIIENEAINGAEKVIGMVKWLADLYTRLAVTKLSVQRKNLIWLAVADAPTGFAHVRNTMLGTLLDDLAAGKSFADVRKAFNEKMNPIKYQRPTAAPTAGNIARAEKLVETLGIESALRRRFATLDDLQCLWRPRLISAPTTDGVFSSVKPKAVKAKPLVNLPDNRKMSWTVFARDILPDAKAIEFWASNGNTNYCAMVTAADPVAPPILQWDSKEKRNPVSLYVYPGGSFPNQWFIKASAWNKINAVTLRPAQWQPGFDHQYAGVIFVIDGAKDSIHRSSGLALFPSNLKSELREVAATIEAYSKKHTIEGYDQASACGILLQKGATWNHKFRVTTATATMTITLDRWE